MIALVLILLALIGTPLFVVIAIGAIFGFYQAELSPLLVAMEFQRIGDLPVLVALPLFTFAGVLVAESRTPARLVDFTHAAFGWLPGGLAILGLILFSLMTAFTGASGITVVALGSLMLPALVQAGYPRRFALGLVTTGSSLGVLFAPSLPLILYAVIAQQVAPGQGIGVDDLVGEEGLGLLRVVAAHPCAFLDFAAGLLGFSLLASAVYVFNDLRDLAADRRSPRKRHRPLASADRPDRPTGRI